jgi:hypothetical protein
MIALGAIVSNAVGDIAYALVHQLCVKWWGGEDVCVTVGKLQFFVMQHAQLVPVMVSAFVFFLVSCRVGHVAGSTLPALGVLVYSGISWTLAEAAFRSVTPQEALAVVFSGASASVYFNWQMNRALPNSALHATREDARA